MTQIVHKTCGDGGEGGGGKVRKACQYWHFGGNSRKDVISGRPILTGLNSFGLLSIRKKNWKSPFGDS